MLKQASDIYEFKPLSLGIKFVCFTGSILETSCIRYGAIVNGQLRPFMKFVKFCACLAVPCLFR